MIVYYRVAGEDGSKNVLFGLNYQLATPRRLLRLCVVACAAMASQSFSSDGATVDWP
jgi:hypothetical protein